MRDNREGMPEILDVFEKDGLYFGVIKIEINEVEKKLQFGVSRNGYLTLKRILQLRPFDSMPGLKHRYFLASVHYQINDLSDGGVLIRVEQGKNGKQVDVRAPQDLFSNLLWFLKLKSFDEASHLPEII